MEKREYIKRQLVFPLIFDPGLIHCLLQPCSEYRSQITLEKMKHSSAEKEKLPIPALVDLKVSPTIQNASRNTVLMANS